ncbi:MAG: DUF1146 family protein [Bacillota bacterium]|jgi:uncharacterized membrane protein YwzB|nr:DUF1146 family protein [Bacillota bacterium]NLL26264.1 DUF1146 domain-containing protein [Erysipelotrichia bacterium]
MYKEITRIALHFIMFIVSFYCLSSLDIAKILLPVENRVAKAQFLVILLSMALGFLSAQFILAIIYRF